MKLRRTIIFCVVSIIANPAVSGSGLFRCDLKAGVYAVSGSLKAVDSDVLKLNTPMLIDTVSGLIRTGEKQKLTRWRVVQEHEPNLHLDWVMKRGKGSSPFWDRADDVIRIRINEYMKEIVYYYNGNIFTGSCAEAN